MKVVVFGASGIVGQHMRLHIPFEDGVRARWFRRTPDPITEGMSDRHVSEILDEIKPDVVVNLAGNNDVDAVERDPESALAVNVRLPLDIATWCVLNKAKYVHVSSQAVFSGNEAPYSPNAPTGPINEYGRQKEVAEIHLRAHFRPTFDCLIVRLSFVLGVRPLPHVGRKNPLESMLDRSQLDQVCNRAFSPLFAHDAALAVWDAVLYGNSGEIRHVGIPHPWSRYAISQALLHCSGSEDDYRTEQIYRPVDHNSFSGIAPRPLSTVYAQGSFYHRDMKKGLRECIDDWNMYGLTDRARELALFFGLRAEGVGSVLNRGFQYLHNEVTNDFRLEAPKDLMEVLDWYRTTDAYIWELSAYHEDSRFNYAGMCQGISDRLTSAGFVRRVLCLGDGIGDMTLALRATGFEAWYHDLADSRTAAYAEFRIWRKSGKPAFCFLNRDWNLPPDSTKLFDAICSADFLEHVPNVEQWVRWVYDALVPGGLFFAQNAFNCGSGPEGDMPMHLAINDRFEKDWDPLLASTGFVQESSNWYRRPV